MRPRLRASDRSSGEDRYGHGQWLRLRRPECGGRLPALHRGMIGVAVVPAPWGPIRLAANEDAVVAVDVLSSPDSFAAACLHRLGEVAHASSDVPATVRRRLDQAGEAISALLAGEPAAAESIP